MLRRHHHPSLSFATAVTRNGYIKLLHNSVEYINNKMSKIDEMNIVVNFMASFYLFYDNRMELNEIYFAMV